MGRLVFTAGGLPTIRLVNHVVDGDDVIVRTHPISAILNSVGSVVAYEADTVDHDRRTGWSVVVTGLARLVEEPEEIARYESMLQPRVDGERAYVLRIQADVVDAFTLSTSGFGDGSTPVPADVGDRGDVADVGDRPEAGV